MYSSRTMDGTLPWPGQAHQLALNSVPGDPIRTYTFMADTDGTFVMSYDVIGTGDLFGLQGWDIAWSGSGGGLNLEYAFDPVANGIFPDRSSQAKRTQSHSAMAPMFLAPMVLIWSAA